MPTTPPLAAAAASVSSSCASSAWRPVKTATSRGSARVAAAANAPGTTACRAASTSAAGAFPRAAATNRSRTGPSSLSAPASNWAVSLCAVRLIPRSRSLTDRGDRPAASASSSWVSLASARSCRSSPANETSGCSATAQPPRDPPPRLLAPGGIDPAPTVRSPARPDDLSRPARLSAAGHSVPVTSQQSDSGCISQLTDGIFTARDYHGSWSLPRDQEPRRGRAMTRPTDLLSFQRIANIPFDTCMAALDSRQLTGHDGEQLLGKNLLHG